MDSLDFQIVDDILDSFAKELVQELGLEKLKLEIELDPKEGGSFYDIVRSVHAERILNVFLPYIKALHRARKIMWSL